MLNFNDLSMVRDYIFRDFPEMRPHVAIRSFDPPAAPELPIEERGAIKPHTFMRWLDDHEKLVYDDLIKQTPWNLKNSMKRSFQRAASSGFWTYWSDRYRFLEYCLSPNPGTFPVDSVAKQPGKGKHYPRHFYVTQQSDKISDETLFKSHLGRSPDENIPYNARRTLEILMLVHEMGHILPDVYFADRNKQECICDMLGTAGVLAIVGEEAFPVIKLVAENRAKMDPKEIHYTAPVLQKALESTSALLEINDAKSAFAFGENIYRELNLR